MAAAKAVEMVGLKVDRMACWLVAVMETRMAEEKADLMVFHSAASTVARSVAYSDSWMVDAMVVWLGERKVEQMVAWRGRLMES